jgi:hypothetical protein
MEEHVQFRFLRLAPDDGAPASAQRRLIDWPPPACAARRPRARCA